LITGICRFHRLLVKLSSICDCSWTCNNVLGIRMKWCCDEIVDSFAVSTVHLVVLDCVCRLQPSLPPPCKADSSISRLLLCASNILCSFRSSANFSSMRQSIAVISAMTSMAAISVCFLGSLGLFRSDLSWLNKSSWSFLLSFSWRLCSLLASLLLHQTSSANSKSGRGLATSVSSRSSTPSTSTSVTGVRLSSELPQGTPGLFSQH